MRTLAMNNFIDNKIRTAICEKKSTEEIINIMKDRIKKMEENTTMRKNFNDYMINFTKKRIDDILFIKKKEKFNNINENKLLNLIRFRDKICGLEIIEI